MGTRAILAVKTNEGYKSAYVHYDGYLDYTGQCLVKYWNSEEKANTLVNYGGMSCLKATEELMKDERYYDEPVQVHYTRTGLGKRAEDQYAFLYVFENGEWNVENKWKNGDTFDFHKENPLANIK